MTSREKEKEQNKTDAIWYGRHHPLFEMDVGKRYLFQVWACGDTDITAPNGDRFTNRKTMDSPREWLSERGIDNDRAWETALIPALNESHWVVNNTPWFEGILWEKTKSKTRENGVTQEETIHSQIYITEPFHEWTEEMGENITVGCEECGAVDGYSSCVCDEVEGHAAGLPTPSMLENAILRGWQEWGVKKSMTGMYQATITHGYDDKGEPDLTTGIEEQCNVCAICLFLEDEPYNYGEIIIPTTYDGDCDECGRFTVDVIGDLGSTYAIMGMSPLPKPKGFKGEEE